MTGTWAPTPTFLYRHRLYRRLLAGSQGQRLLDIGTGNGFLLQYLADNGFRGEAIDISPQALAQARDRVSHGKQIQLTLADFNTWPLAKKYEQICCFEVLEYIENPELFLQKINRHLLPHGRLLLSVPAHKKYWNELDEARGHIQRFEKDDLIKMICDSGFTIKTFWSYGYPFLTGLRAANASGRFIKQTKDKPRYQLATESSLVQEYDPRLKILFNPITLAPLFAIMDLCLTGDKGVGYLVEATAP